MKRYIASLVGRARGRGKGAGPTSVGALLARESAAWEKARRAARGGPKILLATNVTGFQHASLTEAVLGAALTLRGAEVHFLVCDGVLPGCQRAEPDNVPDPGWFARYELPDRICASCQRIGEALIGPLGLPTHRFSALVPAAARSAARSLAQTLPAEAIATYVRDGLRLGEHAHAGALRYFARGDLAGVAAAETVSRRYLEAAILTAEAADALLSAHSFKAACFHHGIYVPQGPFGEVCRARGLPVVNWNPAYRRNTFIFSHDDSYHHTLMAEPVEAWESMPWSDEMEAEIDAYLASRRKGTRDWIWFHEKPDEDFERFAVEAGLRRDKPIIGMLSNVMWDAQLHYPANAFPNMLDWAVKTVAYFVRRPDLQLLLRIHPAEIRGTVPSRQPLLAELRARFPELPPNIVIVPPESQVSTYSAMEACDSVLIYGTKTGVELTSIGIPVIVGGEAWIRNKGLTYDASSESEYFALLDRLPFGSRLPPDVLRRAKKYAYHFFFRRMVPLPFIVPSPGKIYDLALNELAELGPGRHPGLDVVCDGILEGKPFIYPAESLGLHDAGAEARP